MCGRFTLLSDQQVLEKIFGVTGGYSLDWKPHYNIAPSQTIPIIRPDGRGGREFAPVRWGLVPQWARDPSVGARMINARAETLREKPAFRAAFKRRRCVVPASGWYEWQATAQGKQPWYFHPRDGAPLAFAGLWERRDDPATGPLETATIITVEANPALAAIHDRMPALLDADGVARWLDPNLETPEPLQELLHPVVEGIIAGRRVGRAVGNVKNDGPGLIEAMKGE